MDEIPLYNLTPQEFERFVADLLPEAGYKDVRLEGGPGDRGIDISATIDGKEVAFQVKHKTRVSLGDIRRFTERYFADPSVPRLLVFVTSAILPPNSKNISDSLPAGCEINFLDRSDIERLIARHPAAQENWFEAASKRLRSQKLHLLAGVIGVIASVLGSGIFSYTITNAPKKPLDKRIDTVELALTNIRDLETYLSSIKDDMAETEKARSVIIQKYTEAQELEKLTDQQIAAIKSTLQAQTWWYTAFNYFLGFVLGIASSFVSSALYSRWQQRKALN